MRTKLRSKATVLFMTIAVLIAVPAVAAIADTLIISNTIFFDQNAIHSPGEEGRAIVTLQPTPIPPGDTGGCNANPSNPLTVTLSSNNPDVTFPGGNTATFSFCSPFGVPVPYQVSSNAQPGTAVISVDSYSGGVPSTPTAPRLYNTNDTLTVTINAAPKVSQVEPLEDANNVAANTNVTATFSEAMDATTIDGSTFTLAKPDGPDADSDPDPVSGAVSYDSATNKATLDPTADLDYSTTYTATVTTGAQDAAGNALDQDSGTAGNQPMTWSFTTEPPPCTPVSVTQQPDNQSITYGANTTFTADANGTPAPSVQWQVLGTGSGATWTDLGGETSKTLTLNNPSVADSGKQYRAVFTNTCNGTQTATSNPALLTVEKATATVTLNNLTHTYDGMAKSASATTNPSGLNVKFDYSQGGNPVANPTNAGSYDVVATVDDPNYQGSKSGALTIEKATQTIDFGPLADKTFGDPDFKVSATGGASGEPVTFGASGSCQVAKDASSGDWMVRLTGAENCTITASQEGNDNYFAAQDVAQSFTIEKAATTTTVTCTGAPFTYTGEPITLCSATVTGFGLNQSVPVEYDNNVNAGTATARASYAESANHKASSDSENFTIDKANATVNITWSNSTYDGNPNSASANVSGVGTPPENLGSADSLTYYSGNTASGPELSGAPTDAGTYTVKVTYNATTNYAEASATKTITIAQATPTIEWNNPAAIDHGTALSNTQLNAIVKGVDNSVLAGNSVYTPAAGTVLSAGTHTLKVDFTPTDTVNYKGASKEVQITVSAYKFGNGFYQPVDNRILNGVKGGSTVPMKFEVFQTLSGNELKSTSAIKTWSTTEVNCTTAATGEDAIEEYATGNTSLRFDTTGDFFILNWQAPKATASAPVGTCYQVSIVANDGSSPNNVLTALYKIR